MLYLGFKKEILCCTYDDEIVTVCADVALMANETEENRALAQEILDKKMDCDEAQAFVRKML